MAGLVPPAGRSPFGEAKAPSIHVLLHQRKTWMPGSSPGMTKESETTNYCMVIGEKSTNQLFGCTKFFTFGLMARGATSCAT
jgi:hypothetical protein